VVGPQPAPSRGETTESGTPGAALTGEGPGEG
jgi:hypothetical protein